VARTINDFLKDLVMSNSNRMPAIFYGHGNPMNAIEDNVYTRVWQNFGERFPHPKAILAISAHWLTRGTAVTAMTQPETIHDFAGFPAELFHVKYPALGSPALAARIRALLAPIPVTLDHSWGLDHGTWSVLCKSYPEADVPVVQLSIDVNLSTREHFRLGQRLATLRDEGVLIMGSGNIVHNLRRMTMRMTNEGFDWAHRFNDAMVNAISNGDVESVINYVDLGDDASLSVPTSEHFLPLLYVLGAKTDGDAVEISANGMQLDSISMTSVVIN
jgi:4,5-DOPA dioxygenase extradiol